MMNNFYNVNGLVFWTGAEITRRENIANSVMLQLERTLLQLNSGFRFCRIEAPLLTPSVNINPNYTNEDVFTFGDLALRPETTMGSYAAAAELLSPYAPIKRKLPLVVWQHGKSFRREQDQPTKFMRLKEFYQLEFQILFSETTQNDYYPHIVEAVRKHLSFWTGPCRAEASDRLPSYSTETTDIVNERLNMELCSISRRTDFAGAKVIEVAVGTDRCVFASEDQ